MSAMGGMPMPGGWTMSMAWMRMPGQTWPGAAASFLGMWVVMMVAMMLPSLVPMLWRYRAAVSRTVGTRLGAATAMVATAYFLAWAVLGLPCSLSATCSRRSRCSGRCCRARCRSTLGVVVLVAGAFSSGDGRRVTSCVLPVGAGVRAAARPPAPRCGTACASASIAAAAAPDDRDAPGRRRHGPARDGGCRDRHHS